MLLLRGLLPPAVTRQEASVVEMLRRIASWRGQRPTRHGRRELARRSILHTRRSIHLYSRLVALATELLTKLTEQFGREGISLLPDFDHPIKLILLIGRDHFDDVVEQSRHEFRDALHRGRIRAGLTSAIDVQILAFLLRLLDPSAYDTIDHVDGTELVRCRSFLQCAVKRLYEV